MIEVKKAVSNIQQELAISRISSHYISIFFSVGHLHDLIVGQKIVALYLSQQQRAWNES